MYGCVARRVRVHTQEGCAYHPTRVRQSKPTHPRLLNAREEKQWEGFAQEETGQCLLVSPEPKPFVWLTLARLESADRILQIAIGSEDICGHGAPVNVQQLQDGIGREGALDGGRVGEIAWEPSSQDDETARP